MNYDVDFKDQSCNIKINHVASRSIMLHQDKSCCIKIKSSYIKIYLIEFIKEKDSEFRNPFLLYPDSNKI